MKPQRYACLLLLVTACAVEVPAPRQLSFLCREDAECSSGYRCSGGTCVLLGGDRDAAATSDVASTAPDAAADARPTVDAHVSDTSVLDAAMPDSLVPDSSTPDTSLPDRSSPEAPAADLSVPDIARPDTPRPDTSRPDTWLPDTTQPDTAQPDVGGADSGLPNYLEVSWDPPTLLTETVDPSRCETDPVLTPDERWLILTRPETAGAGCYQDRRFHIFEWHDGAPVYRAMLPKFDVDADENNPHPVAGEVAGRPGETLLVHTVYAATTELRGVWLQGDPPVTPAGPPFPLTSVNGGGGASSPTLTFAADRIAFVRDSDLYEAVGAAPDSFGTASCLDSVSSDESDTDPALSPDGRVLVFVRSVAGTGDDFDLWVARRSDPDAPFGAPIRLPLGDGEINTDAAEMDAFITTSGDLLYMSARADGSTRRIYIARRAGR